MIDPNLAAEIESCSFLSLRELREPKANSVLLVLDEAIIGSPAPNIAVGNKTLNDLRHIEVTPSSRTFEMLWDKYIAYSVRNESFGLPGVGEDKMPAIGFACIQNLISWIILQTRRGVMRIIPAY